MNPSLGTRFVYALLDEEGCIRYVGQARDVKRRRRTHWGGRKVAQGANLTPIQEWLCTLKKPPAVSVLEEVPAGDAFAAEARWIKQLGHSADAALLNLQHTGRQLPDEHRRAISESKRGKPTPSHVVSDEARRKMSEARLGKWFPPKDREAWLEKKAAARRGYKHSEETLAKLRGRKTSPEQRANMRAAALSPRTIPVTCDVCGAGPFAGNAGAASHKSKRHGYHGRREVA